MGNCLSSNNTSSSSHDTLGVVNFDDHTRHQNSVTKARYTSSLHAHKLRITALHSSNHASNKGSIAVATGNGDPARFSNPFTDSQTPPSSSRSSAAGSLLESHVPVRAVSNNMRLSSGGISLRSSMSIARMKPSQHSSMRVNTESPLTGEVSSLMSLHSLSRREECGISCAQACV